MNGFIMTFFLSILILLPARSGEVSGASFVQDILSKNQLDQGILEAMKLKLVKKGEVTGAGERIPLDHLQFAITKEELIHRIDMVKISVKNQPTLDQISDILLNDKKVKRREIEAFIIKYE